MCMVGTLRTGLGRAELADRATRLIAEELEALAKVNDLGAGANVRHPHLPELSRLAESTDPAIIQSWILQTTPQLWSGESDEEYNVRAATEKLYAPFDDDGSRRPFSDRRAAAGQAIGHRDEAFRKKRSNGSHFNHFLLGLAGGFADRATAPTGHADLEADRPVVRSIRSLSRGPMLLSGIALVAVVTVAVAVLSAHEGEDRAAKPLTASSVVQSAQTDRSAAPTSGAPDSTHETPKADTCPATVEGLLATAPRTTRERVQPFVSGVAALIGASECPSLAMYDFGGELFVQQVVDKTGVDVGVVATKAPAAPVRLSFAQWAAFKETSGLADESAATAIAGYPTGAYTKADWSFVDLSLGGMLVGKRTDGPHFWLPHQVRPAWEMRGGLEGTLGAPSSGLYLVEDSVAVLEFERGFVQAPSAEALAGDLTNLEVFELDEAERLARLNELGEFEGRIVEQTAGPTAWWIEDGKRYWIADAATWTCLGGNEAVAARRVPSWALSNLPEASSNASCT
jgi:hypothetical protein